MIMTATTLSKNGNSRNPTKPAALRAVRVKQHWKNTKSQRRTLNVLNRNLIDNTGAVLCNLGHLVSIMAGYDPEISAGTFKEHRHYFSLFTLNWFRFYVIRVNNFSFYEFLHSFYILKSTKLKKIIIFLY